MAKKGSKGYNSFGIMNMTCGASEEFDMTIIRIFIQCQPAQFLLSTYIVVIGTS